MSAQLRLTADAVVLDLDGLLIDSESAAFVVAREIFAEEGARLSRDLFAEHVGHVASHLYAVLVRHFGLSSCVDELLQRRQIGLEQFYAHPTPIDGAIDFIREMGTRDVAVGVASSSHISVVTSVISALGLTSDVRVIMGRGGAFTGSPKPSPDLYTSALRQLGVHASVAVGVEDSATGAAASVAAGLTTVVIPNEWTRGHEFPSTVLRAESLADVDITPRRELTSECL